MKTITDEERRKKKREVILEAARAVFTKKGLIGVTMKDIIEEAGISRGGIYLYFDSVDEIFIETMRQRSEGKFDGVRQSAQKNVPFEDVLADYFAGHKDRLLNHVSNGMLRATYEYYYTHKTPADHEIQQAQLATTLKTIVEILNLGVSQGVLEDTNLDQIAETFMFVIEGMSVLAITGSISAKQIDDQIFILRTLLPRKESEENAL